MKLKSGSDTERGQSPPDMSPISLAFWGAIIIIKTKGEPESDPEGPGDTQKKAKMR